jgi:hypothetical protein
LRIVLGWNILVTIIQEEQEEEDTTTALAATVWIVLLLSEGTCFGTSRIWIGFACYENIPIFFMVDTSTADVDKAVYMDRQLPNTTGITLVEECADLNTLATEEESKEDM